MFLVSINPLSISPSTSGFAIKRELYTGICMRVALIINTVVFLLLLGTKRTQKSQIYYNKQLLMINIDLLKLNDEKL